MSERIHIEGEEFDEIQKEIARLDAEAAKNKEEKSGTTQAKEAAQTEAAPGAKNEILSDYDPNATERAPIIIKGEEFDRLQQEIAKLDAENAQKLAEARKKLDDSEK